MNDQIPDWLFSSVYIASIFAATAFVPLLVLAIKEHPQIWFNSALVLVWMAYAATIVWIWSRYPLQAVRSALRSIGLVVAIGLASYGVMAHFSSGPVVHTRR